MKCRTAVTVLAVIVCCGSCASPAGQDRPLFDMWIAAEIPPLAPFVKIGFTRDGAEELYHSLQAKEPFLRNKVRIVGEGVDDAGNRIYGLQEYICPPFVEKETLVAYVLARISRAGTVLELTDRADAMPQTEDDLSFIRFYRSGSVESLQVKEPVPLAAFIVLDSSNPAFLDIIGAPDNESFAAWKASGQAKAPGIECVPWSEFLMMSVETIHSAIVKDLFLYPYLISSVIAFFRAGGDEIGITWNGGIAYTLSDYMFAEEDYDSFTEDQNKFMAGFEPSSSPHFPAGQFGWILGALAERKGK